MTISLFTLYIVEYYHGLMFVPFPSFLWSFYFSPISSSPFTTSKPYFFTSTLLHAHIVLNLWDHGLSSVSSWYIMYIVYLCIIPSANEANFLQNLIYFGNPQAQGLYYDGFFLLCYVFVIVLRFLLYSLSLLHSFMVLDMDKNRNKTKRIISAVISCNSAAFKIVLSLSFLFYPPSCFFSLHSVLSFFLVYTCFIIMFIQTNSSFSCLSFAFFSSSVTILSSLLDSSIVTVTEMMASVYSKSQ